MSNQNKQLYIVISQTGTLLSRILKQITGAEYNHASISLSRDLERMYSFGRRHPYNPFWGGFVIESPRTGTFKRFSETKVLVLSVSVTEEQHAELKEMLDVMWKRRRKYSYNYIGLCLAYFHVVWKQEGCYYCSEFVGELLTKVGLTARNSYVPLSYSRCSSLECRTHCSTAENFANTCVIPVLRVYVKMQRTAQCIGDCHNSRQGGAWSSICKGVVLIRRHDFCFLPS